MKIALIFVLAVVNLAASPWLKELPPHAALDACSRWHGKVSVMSSRPGQGNSMRPLIVPTDRMLWTAYTRQPLVGQIVSIDRGPNHLPMVHAVLAETDHMILARGINNTRDDGWTSKAWVQGVLVGIVRTKP